MHALDLDGLRETFLVEAREHLEALTSGLVALQDGEPPPGELDRLFRAAHSVKGGAGACHLDPVVRLTHTMEHLLDDVRNEVRPLDAELLSALLAASDRLEELLDRVEEGEEEAPPWLGEAVAALKAEAERGPAIDDPSLRGPRHDWRIQIAPNADILQACNDPFPVLELLSGEGKAQVLCDVSGAPPLGQLDPTELHLTWTVELKSGPERSDLDDILLILRDEARIEVGPLVKAAAKKPAARRKSTTPRAKGTIRVDTKRIDTLLDEVGELVMANAIVAERAAEAAASDAALAQGLKSLQQRMRALQYGVLAMRMRPIRDLFERVPRLVFELSRDLGKKARVDMDGEWTEVDREVLEKLSDPIVHLVRNSMDHGLETPEKREANGKDPQGVVRLSAAHQGGDVVITIADDGAGIDPARVLAKGIERGLVSASDTLSEQEILELIFRPGFSTAEQVTDVSGRGVGMDVVRQNIQALGGRVDVRSTLGKGSRFDIALPLTLAILDGQLLSAGGESFVLPVRSMVTCLRPPADSIHTIHGEHRTLVLRGDPLSLVDLSATFGGRPAGKDALVVIVEAAGRRLALVVDALDTQRQFVLKSLDRHHKVVPGLAGATVLTDGSLAMVLDASTLISVGPDGLRGMVSHGSSEPRPGPVETTHYVTFVVGDSEFALPACQVVELRGWQRVTTVPFSRMHMLGATAFAGDVVPVLDGRSLLAGLRDRDPRDGVILFAEDTRLDEPRRVGLVVDEVREVREVDPSRIRPSEEPGLVHAMVAEEKGVIGILDVSALTG